MKDAREIIRSAGGVTALARRLGLGGKPTTVQSWHGRNSIPKAYWTLFNELGIATLDELAYAASKTARDKRRPATQAA